VCSLFPLSHILIPTFVESSFISSLAAIEIEGCGPASVTSHLAQNNTTMKLEQQQLDIIVAAESVAIRVLGIHGNCW